MPTDDEDPLMWQLGTPEPGADYKIFTTRFVEGNHPGSGKATRFSLIEAVDWVNVIALTPADDVVMIRQYRPGTHRVHLEIPGGMVDSGETVAYAARRELEEETGYKASTWHKLGRVAPNPAIQNNYLHTFIAFDATPTGTQRLDDAEVVAIDLIPLAKIHEMIFMQQIDHALVVTAFAHLAMHGGPLRRPNIHHAR